MEIKLVKISSEPVDDALYSMLQDIGPGENGFVNNFYINDRAECNRRIYRNYEIALGIDLEPNYVQQTIFWCYLNDVPIGYTKLRHGLTAQLREHGGHIGYILRPSYRGKGFGKLVLQALLYEAYLLNLDKVLLTVDSSNIASRKIIEWNSGKLEYENDNTCYYWIETATAK